MAGERILIVEDEKLIRASLADQLRHESYAVDEAADGRTGIARIDAEEYDAILLDYRLPDTDGLAVLKHVVATAPETPVILMTAYSSIENVVEAMKLGAYDYVTKPFDMEEMLLAVRKALETTRLRRDVRFFAKAQKDAFGFTRIIGRSEAMQTLLAQVKRVIRSGTSTILIGGESGTGKDLLAKAIHYESDRARAPFVNVTCTAIPEHLLESELFGHERGAFTDARSGKKGLFELARGGTVFLDEIGDMSPALQAKLLRFLEERSFKRVGGTEDINVDVRIVAATNRDLEAAVKAGTFRGDLYYRLKVIPLHVAPLRERREDVPLLAMSFVETLNKEFKKRVTGISPRALDLLQRHDWPGNVRELRNVIERALILGGASLIDVDDLPPEIARHAATPPAPSSAVEAPALAPAPPPRLAPSPPPVAAAPAPPPVVPAPAPPPVEPAPAPTRAEPAPPAPPAAASPEPAALPPAEPPLFVLPPGGIQWDELERLAVTQALERAAGNQSGAARLLGISRDQLRYRMERFGLLSPPPKRRKVEH